MTTSPNRPIRSLLVANRGEIARRVMRTAKAMGITTVAVFSDADESALHVRDSDIAVRLPGNTPAQTYLRSDLIIAAAQRAGADAIHPGYGFLAENPSFAAAVLDGGLTWVGPPPAAIEAMGSKLASKELMAASGVPTLPWTTSVDDAAKVGFPLLVKASAGGGGRGMRVVRSAAELAEAVASARREAGSAFGDDTVFLERYVDDPRHVEIQIFADRHGNVVSLFERECSIQRRHQKIVEESPSPAVTPELRTRMGDAAVAAARAVGYEGAGTVEFVLDATAEFSFLEMNTRLQVEHPVTEAVTGLDLVRLQLLVAAGQPLPAEALTPALNGHAIEVRLCAEDARNDYLPQSGSLRSWSIPNSVREDSGVESGSIVSPFYDPMLAKVIAHAPSRSEAAAALASALRSSEIAGVMTNRDLLIGILCEPEFLAGGTDTGYLVRHDPADLSANGLAAAAERVHLIAAAVALRTLNRREARVWAALPAGWRNNPSQVQQVRLVVGGREVSVGYQRNRDLDSYVLGGGPVLVDVHSTGIASDAVAVDLTVDDLRVGCRVKVARSVDGSGPIDVFSVLGTHSFDLQPRFLDPASVIASGSLVAPMPGSVVRVAVEVGTKVEPGTTLVVLEAMKMEHSVSAPAAGVVAEVAVKAGQQVQAGDVLVVVTGDESGTEDAAAVAESGAIRMAPR